jgi:hypothetical protein
VSVPAGAIDDVVARPGVDQVVECVAGAVHGAGGDEVEVLDVGAEGVIDQGVDGVDAARCGGIGFRDDVAGVVDDIEVAAVAAEHRVGSGSAIEGVVAGAAIEDVITTVTSEIVVEAAAGEVLDADQRV